MPLVAIPLIPILIGIVFIALHNGQDQWVAPTVSSIWDVVKLPYTLVEKSLEYVTVKTANSIAKWLNANLNPVASFFAGIGRSFSLLANESVFALNKVVDSLYYVVHVATHVIVKAYLVPVRAAISEARIAAQEATNFALTVEADALRFADAAYTKAYAWTNATVSSLIRYTITPLRNDVDFVLSKVRQYDANFVQLAEARLISLAGEIRAELPSIRDLTGVFRKAEDIATLGGLVAIGAVLVKWFRECEPHKACFRGSDSDQLDSLFAAELPAIEMSALVALVGLMVEESKLIAGELQQWIGER